MNHFHYRDGEMFAEGVPVRRIAKEVGTPAYIYSLATLRRHFRVFDGAFSKVPHIVCFSVKANSNLALLRTFAKEGSGFDIVSIQISFGCSRVIVALTLSTSNLPMVPAPVRPAVATDHFSQRMQ